MISAEIRVEGFDARSWANLLSLFVPGVIQRLQMGPQESDAPELEGDEQAARPSGTLVIVISESGEVLKAFHSQGGRIRGLVYEGPDSLPSLVARYHARAGYVIKRGAIEEITERLAQRLERGDDYALQWLMVARIVRDAMDNGQIELWPRPLANLPIPTMGMVDRAIDTVLPHDRAMVMVIWNRGQPWTGAVLRRSGGDIDLLAGPDLIARWSGPLAGDWRRDHRFISDGIARAVAPVHLGIYGEIDSIRALLRNAERGAWARAVAMREIIVSPTPPYVAVALGADAARAAAQRAADWLGGIDALATLAPVASYVRGRVREIASVTQTLGFDPLKVLAGVLERSEQLAERFDEPREEFGAERSGAAKSESSRERTGNRPSHTDDDERADTDTRE